MTAQSMMKVKFTRPKNFTQMTGREMEKLKDRYRYLLILGLTDFQNAILTTPVYTGRTLVNFQWSIGAPVETTRPAVKDPPRPGTTSAMAIGSEPRRPANAAVVQEEFEAIIAAIRVNPFQDIFLVNNLEHFSDVEYGMYSTRGKKVRTPPGGMTRRGETLLQYDTLEFLKRVS
jgi:hypothetical protein